MSPWLLHRSLEFSATSISLVRLKLSLGLHKSRERSLQLATHTSPFLYPSSRTQGSNVSSSSAKRKTGKRVKHLSRFDSSTVKKISVDLNGIKVPSKDIKIEVGTNWDSAYKEYMKMYSAYKDPGAMGITTQGILSYNDWKYYPLYGFDVQNTRNQDRDMLLCTPTILVLLYGMLFIYVHRLHCSATCTDPYRNRSLALSMHCSCRCRLRDVVLLE